MMYARLSCAGEKPSSNASSQSSSVTTRTPLGASSSRRALSAGCVTTTLVRESSIMYRSRSSGYSGLNGR